MKCLYTYINLSICRHPKLLRPGHSCSGSRDNAANDPSVRCRIYLKNQLCSGRACSAQRHLGPKSADHTTPHSRPSPLSQSQSRCSLSSWPHPGQEPCPQPASYGGTGCSPRPHSQEAWRYCLWARYVRGWIRGCVGVGVIRILSWNEMWLTLLCIKATVSVCISVHYVCSVE